MPLDRVALAACCCPCGGLHRHVALTSSLTDSLYRGRKWYQSGHSSGISQSLLQDGGTYSRACLCGCGQGANLGLLRFPLPLPRSHDHPLCQSHHGPLQCHPHIHLGGAAPGRLRHRTSLSVPDGHTSAHPGQHPASTWRLGVAMTTQRWRRLSFTLLTLT